MTYTNEKVLIMDDLKKFISYCLQCRQNFKIPLKQPLAHLIIYKSNSLETGEVNEFLLRTRLSNKDSQYREILLNALQVKDILIIDCLEIYSERVLKLNFKLLGARLPHKIKELKLAAKNNDFFITEDKIVLIAEEELIDKEYSYKRQVSNLGQCTYVEEFDLVIGFDPRIEDLKEEYFVNLVKGDIQRQRKELGFAIGDKVDIEILYREKYSYEDIWLTNNVARIQQETLSSITLLCFADEELSDSVLESLNNRRVAIKIKKPID